MGKAERERGVRGERLLVSEFRAAGYDTARRAVQYAGKPEQGSADVVGVPGLYLESKFVERLSVREAYENAVLDSHGNGIPVVAWKKNNCRWLAVLSLDDFITLYREWEMSFRKDGEKNVNG